MIISLLLLSLLILSLTSSNFPFLHVRAISSSCGSDTITFDEGNVTSGYVTFDGSNYTDGQDLNWNSGCAALITANPPSGYSFSVWNISSNGPNGIALADSYNWNTTLTNICPEGQNCQETITASYTPNGVYCNDPTLYPHCAAPPTVDGTIRFVRFRAFQTDNACITIGQNCNTPGGCDASSGIYYEYWAACSTVQNETYGSDHGYPQSCASSPYCYTIYPADAIISQIKQVVPTYLERMVSGDWYTSDNLVNHYYIPCIYSNNQNRLNGCTYYQNENGCLDLINQGSSGTVTIDGCMTLLSFLEDSLAACSNVEQTGGLTGCQLIPRVDLICWESNGPGTCYQNIGYIDPGTNPPSSCSVYSTQFTNEIQGIENVNSQSTWPSNQKIESISLDNWKKTMYDCFHNNGYETQVDSLFKLIYGVISATPQYGVGVNIQVCPGGWSNCSTKGTGTSPNPWVTWADVPISYTKNGGNGLPCQNTWNYDNGPLVGEEQNGLSELIAYIDSPSPLQYFVCQSNQGSTHDAIYQEYGWYALSNCQDYFQNLACGTQPTYPYWLLYEAFQWGNIDPTAYLHNGYDWTDQLMAVIGSGGSLAYQISIEHSLMLTNNCGTDRTYPDPGCLA